MTRCWVSGVEPIPDPRAGHVEDERDRGGLDLRLRVLVEAHPAVFCVGVDAGRHAAPVEVGEVVEAATLLADETEAGEEEGAREPLETIDGAAVATLVAGRRDARGAGRRPDAGPGQQAVGVLEPLIARPVGRVRRDVRHRLLLDRHAISFEWANHRRSDRLGAYQPNLGSLQEVSRVFMIVSDRFTSCGDDYSMERKSTRTMSSSTDAVVPPAAESFRGPLASIFERQAGVAPGALAGVLPSLLRASCRRPPRSAGIRSVRVAGRRRRSDGRGDPRARGSGPRSPLAAASRPRCRSRALRRRPRRVGAGRVRASAAPQPGDGRSRPDRSRRVVRGGARRRLAAVRAELVVLARPRRRLPRARMGAGRRRRALPRPRRGRGRRPARVARPPRRRRPRAAATPVCARASGARPASA